MSWNLIDSAKNAHISSAMQNDKYDRKQLKSNIYLSNFQQRKYNPYSIAIACRKGIWPVKYSKEYNGDYVSTMYNGDYVSAHFQ